MASISGNEPPDLRDLLAFYAAAGVDDALVDDPIDRFAENAQRQAAPARQAAQTVQAGEGSASRPGADRSAPPPPQRPAIATVPDEVQAAAARELASKAATLDELKQIMAGFDGCNLKATAKSMVFADGNPEADLMLVGEAPGRDEDLEGLPFVGRSGQLLDRILAAIGLDRKSAYIANVIPWRPPGNRTPTPHETEICRPFVERQIALARPKVLVTLGGPSAKLLVGSQDGILRLRGSWKSHVTADGTVIPVMPTLHPAYLLRNPAHKKLAWRDFLEAKAKLRELGSL
ncbi:DNA polymerase [Aminobacter aminovorans]|uniref:Type-4 uracil-DNA glycosylase n=1 Tax=Aminobacter aminovorans TaxID=83263 RepID=A0A380WQ07_AMIAI|nr:uracil-DNA glycosylase [Aminobacter aminovorans]TCS30188.1 DNA polymerase [Aminobacter aminovorans]SUU91037.1 uracil-DNA glycosylase, family 4 [Aminobacter aminovorans]